MSSPRLDAFEILAELERLGVSNSEVARRLDRSPNTIYLWKMGTEPRWSDGQQLLDILDKQRRLMQVS